MGDEVMRRKCSVDIETINEYSGGDKEVAKELVDSFVSRLTQVQLPEMQKALSEKDHSKLFFHAHTIKGSSGYVGAKYIQWLADRLSTVTRDPHGDNWSLEAESLLSELKPASKATAENLNSYLLS